MLIEDGSLNEKEFKEFFEKLKWIKVPRKLSQKVPQYFYLASFEDNNQIVKISIRPTMIMKISESFKGFDKLGNKKEGGAYEFGTTIEVSIDESFMNVVKKVAKKPAVKKIQKISWGK